MSAVSLTVSGLNVSAYYAAAQGTVVGLDQINAKLPRNLAGRGEVEVNLTEEGQMANAVRIFMR